MKHFFFKAVEVVEKSRVWEIIFKGFTYVTEASFVRNNDHRLALGGLTLGRCFEPPYATR